MVAASEVRVAHLLVPVARLGINRVEPSVQFEALKF
jgi:hypothetical protein